MVSRISALLMLFIAYGACGFAQAVIAPSVSVALGPVPTSNLRASEMGESGKLAEMDAYCSERGKEDLNESEKLTRVEAFYSWKIHTCVQIEVDGSVPSWSYDLVDVSDGFLRGPQTVKTEIPLKVFDHENLGIASAEGFWVSTDVSKDKQLVSQIAVKIECNRSEKTCREYDAALFMGMLQPQSQEYEISTWNRTGIVADDSDGGSCGIGHRLSIDFASNSVTVTDYPMKTGGGTDCKAFQTANSYSLHGGIIGIMGQKQIFGCTKDGANSAVVAKVNEYHGHVADKAYALWMDNGEGGPPATVKTPAHPYSKSDCERMMQKKLAELKGE